MFKKLIAVALIACFTSLSANAAIFLQIPGVDGESQDANHDKWIDILAWSWATTSTDRGGTCIEDISFAKYIDLASPTLLMDQARGKVYPTATLAVTTRGETQIEYIKLEFKNLIISSVSTGGSAGEDRLTENMTFSFEEVKYTYTPQRRDGSVGASVSATIQAGKNCK